MNPFDLFIKYNLINFAACGIGLILLVRLIILWVKRENDTNTERWTLLAAVVIFLGYGSYSGYQTYLDVYEPRIHTVQGVVEREKSVGNHGNYSAVLVDGVELHNPSKKFEFIIGETYEIAYFEHTRFIFARAKVEEQSNTE